MKLKVQYIFSIMIRWLFRGKKTRIPKLKSSLVVKLHSAVQIWMPGKSFIPHRTVSAVWENRAPLHSWLHSVVLPVPPVVAAAWTQPREESPRQSPSSWGCQCSGADLIILHLFFMEVQLLLPTSKLVLAHTRKEQLALVVAQCGSQRSRVCPSWTLSSQEWRERICCQPGSIARLLQ